MMIVDKLNPVLLRLMIYRVIGVVPYLVPRKIVELVEEVPVLKSISDMECGTNAWTAGQKNVAIFWWIGCFLFIMS